MTISVYLQRESQFKQFGTKRKPTERSTTKENRIFFFFYFYSIVITDNTDSLRILRFLATFSFKRNFLKSYRKFLKSLQELFFLSKKITKKNYILTASGSGIQLRSKPEFRNPTRVLPSDSPS